MEVKRQRSLQHTVDTEKYETDERYRFNDRLARTLSDNNHEVINVATGFAFFPQVAQPAIDRNAKKIPEAVSVPLTINDIISHKYIIAICIVTNDYFTGSNIARDRSEETWELRSQNGQLIFIAKEMKFVDGRNLK